MKAIAAILLALAVLGAGGWFGYNSMFPVIEIPRKIVDGEVWEYTASVKGPIAGVSFEGLAVTRCKVAGIDNEGKATIIESSVKMTQSANGTPIPVDNDEPVTYRIPKSGPNETGSYANFQESLQKSGDPFLSTMLPTDGQRAGKEWTVTPGAGMSVKGKFLGYDSVDGKRTIKVDCTMKGQEQGMTLEAKQVVHLDAESGWIVKSEGTLKITGQPSGELATSRVGKKVK
ncbi:MAG: hypothetical protein HUU60_11285 [Armatimonadetes bacterium]|nr:hypothetical protein [Armatimonadota bacterium]